ncbi:MAG: BsuBI/PstI family type II restriction endonuclease [Rubricoccaceae bacterium]
MSTRRVSEAQAILEAFGFPPKQHNERSAYCLLALANVTPKTGWGRAEQRMIGITPIMDWMAEHYGQVYAPNSRETVRRQTMHQFVDAGFAVLNPDRPDRPPNSGKTVYQLSSEALDVIRSYDTAQWKESLASYLERSGSLSEKYRARREMAMVPIRTASGKMVNLAPGSHSELIRAITEEFAERYAPGAILLYAGGTGAKYAVYEAEGLKALGVELSKHGKMPDVVLHDTERNWLLLVEAVTSHGPVDPKRHGELTELFKGSTAGLVYVTAFPDRAMMARYLPEIAWETEVWVADSPSHLIHFNGERYLGPYGE